MLNLLFTNILKYDILSLCDVIKDVCHEVSSLFSLRDKFILSPRFGLGQCIPAQDCAALGYTESSCDGGKGVKCPFGNGWFCAEGESTVCAENGFKYSCTGTGYAGGAGSACGGKYTQCTCASGYEWKDGKCQQKAPDYSLCKFGALFYSDGTCSDDKLSDKELLGVVVYEKTASESGWVMAVNPTAIGVAWGIPGVTTGITDQAADASCSNTQKLVALGSDYKAAYAASNYNAGNKTWCLPSHGILLKLNNTTNFTKINNAIAIAGGTILGNVHNGFEHFWSSSEYDSYYAWDFHANTAGSFPMDYNSYKSDTNGYRSVRPVFAF